MCADVCRSLLAVCLTAACWQIAEGRNGQCAWGIQGCQVAGITSKGRVGLDDLELEGFCASDVEDVLSVTSHDREN